MDGQKYSDHLFTFVFMRTITYILTTNFKPRYRINAGASAVFLEEKM
jgi:hypothetical protein